MSPDGNLSSNGSLTAYSRSLEEHKYEVEGRIPFSKDHKVQERAFHKKKMKHLRDHGLDNIVYTHSDSDLGTKTSLICVYFGP